MLLCRSAVIALLLWAGVAYADDPLAVLREVGKTWTFERMVGPSVAKLTGGKGPRMRCKVTAASADGGVTQSTIECGLVSVNGETLVDPEAETLHLVFEGGGVRELRHGTPEEIADKGHVWLFTIPRLSAYTWRRQPTRGRGEQRIAIRVHDEKQTVNRVKTAVWIAETTLQNDDGSPAEPSGAVAAFAVGVGPTLRCMVRRADPAYRCWRLASDEPVLPDREVAPSTQPGRGPSEPAPAQKRVGPRVAVASSRAENKSSLSERTVAAKIGGGYSAGIRKCYADLLRRKPSWRGPLQLDFTVNAVGKLGDVKARASDDGLAKCVGDAMASWSFPIPQSEYGEPRNARFVIDLKLSNE